MKVLLLNGSPHTEGCTNRALQEIIKELHKEGIETELMQVGIHTIRGCKGCGMCRKNKLGTCIFGDDPVRICDILYQNSVKDTVYYGVLATRMNRQFK